LILLNSYLFANYKKLFFLTCRIKADTPLPIFIGLKIASFFVILSHKKSNMRLFLKIALLFTVVNVFSQEEKTDVPTIKTDSLYREDQFYFGLIHNTLQDKPTGLLQNKFSPGITFGFLRDMPINKARTFAIAPGFGFSYNKYIQNIAITEEDGEYTYAIIDTDTDYDTNKFSQLLVEVPFELRWRTSTPESYKFWRVHAGFKLGYMLYNRSVYEDSDGKTVIVNNKDFNKFQYGVYLSTGYNYINVYAYYGFKKIFNSVATSTESLDVNSLNIGIVFYLL
jgi:hypothetical protein